MKKQQGEADMNIEEYMREYGMTEKRVLRYKKIDHQKYECKLCHNIFYYKFFRCPNCLNAVVPKAISITTR